MKRHWRAMRRRLRRLKAMTHADSSAAPDAIRAAALPLSGSAHDYDALLEQVGDARFVLIGEATHGTHEFYAERAAITRRLIAEKGFAAVAVEADWPDAYRVNCYVRGAGDDRSPEEALRDFERFPTWMWRNTVVREFVGWLRDYNRQQAEGAPQVGFYGLDLYSLYASIQAVVRYLDNVDPEAARRARERYSCFEFFGRDPQMYGYATSTGTETCEDDVVNQLVELQRQAAEVARRDGHVAEDAHFYAEQNARLVKNAERYYRAMFRGRDESWNLRDSHMAETLERLAEHLDRQFGRANIVVWEHNSHLGDARATEMGDGGELNVGQLVRERYGHEALLVGFSTYTGSVTAASNWDGPAEHKRVRPALPESYEALFHDVGMPRFMLMLNQQNAATEALRARRLERAIGVIYRPQTERYSHYFYARLPEQFDAIIHLDETRALEPLDRTSGREEHELPETFPSGQ
jgi:erythromycin esterase-like protein